MEGKNMPHNSFAPFVEACKASTKVFLIVPATLWKASAYMHTGLVHIF